MGKNILIGVVVLVALLAGAVVVAPSFIDSQAIKHEITAQVRTATGRDLSIGGNLEIRVFPTPSLRANNVRLSNAADGEASHMVALQAVEVRVALAPLLSGQVQVEQVRLVSPEIYIESFKDGRTNFQFDPPVQAQKPDSTPGSEAGEPASSAPSGGQDMNIRLDNFEVVDGRVVYLDMKTGTVEQVENIDATLRANSLKGPFEAIGQARVRGIPVAYEMSLGQIIEERTVPINALIKGAAGSQFQMSGGIFGLEAKPRIKGTIQGQGENLAKLLDSVLGAGTAPKQLGQSFGLETAINGSAKALELTDIEVHLGESRLTGEVVVALKDGVDFKVDLKSSHLNLDAFGVDSPKAGQSANTPNRGGDKGAEEPKVIPDPPKMKQAEDKPAQPFAFPKDLHGTVQVRVDTITLQGEMISNVQLAAELADGELALSQLQAMAPGVTDIAAFGFVAPKDGQPHFQGNVEMTTADPLSLAKWLGVQLPPEIAGRVKRISYQSKINANPKQVVISGLKIKADKSTLSGGVTLAVRERLSFGADLILDSIDLDTYLNGKARPATPVQSGPIDAKLPKTVAAPQQKATAKPADDLTQAMAVFSALNSFDANMKFQVKNLVHQGEKMKDFLFDGTLYAGKLDLRSLKVGDYLGAQTNMSGAISGFGGIPEMTGVKLNAKVKNLAKMAANLGVPDVPAGLTAVGVNSTLNGSLLQPKLDSQVTALGGTVASKGKLSLLPIGFGYNGTANVNFKDVEAVLKALAIDYTPKGPLGALALSTNVSTDGQSHKLTGLKSTLGETAIDGDVTAAMGGAKPRITADLKTGGLVLDRFLPRGAKTASLKPRGSRLGKAIAAKRDNVVFANFGPDQLAAVDKRWSREKFDLSVLNTMDGDVTLKSEFIQFGDYKLDNADIHANVSGGVLNADRVQGSLFGGPVNGSAIVRAQGAPTIESDIKLDALKVGQAVKAVTGKNLADGAMSMAMNFNANGFSPADLVSSLAGQGSLNINGLDAKSGGKGTALSGVIGLVAAMNQLSLTKKEGNGLADLALAFDIQDGIANASNLSLKSAMGNGSGSGKVDIAGWGIDFAGEMTVEPNLVTSLLSKGKIGRQQVPFSLKGALDNPAVKLSALPAPGLGGSSGGTASPTEKIDPFKSLIEKALPGVKLPSKQSTQPSQPPATTNPQQPDGTLAPPPPASGGQSSGSSNQNTKPNAQDLLKGLLRGL